MCRHRGGQQGRSADEEHRPSDSEQDQRDRQQHHRRLGSHGIDDAEGDREDEDTGPTCDDDSRTPPVGHPAEHRGQSVHAGDVDAHDDADRTEAELLVIHVHRGHDHDVGHHHLPRDDRDHREQRHRAGQGEAQRFAEFHRGRGGRLGGGGSVGRSGFLRRGGVAVVLGRALTVVAGFVEPVFSGVVGAGGHRFRQGRGRQCGQGERDHGDEVGPGQAVHAQRFAEVGARGGEAGAEDGADGRRPHHQRHRAAGGGRVGEVDGGVTGLQARGCRGPAHHHPEHEQGKELQGDADEYDHGAERADAETQGQRLAATRSAGEDGEWVGDEAGTEDDAHLGEPGHRCLSGDLFGEQSADGIAGGDAGSGEELGGDEFGLFADVAGHGGLTSSWWSRLTHSNLHPSWIQGCVRPADGGSLPGWTLRGSSTHSSLKT